MVSLYTETAEEQSMQVNGEEYLLINGWMNFLVLLLAARLGKCPFYPARTAVSALLGAGYALIAWGRGGAWRGIGAMILAALIMAFIGFGRCAFRAWPLIFAGGLLLSGCADFLWKKGISVFWLLALCGGVTGMVCFLLRCPPIRETGHFQLHIIWRNQQAICPAFRDSGNFLQDPVIGLPVIVLSSTLAAPLLPPQVHPADLSTLPPGWRLIRIDTAAGHRTLMCFHPDRIDLMQGTRKRRVEAVVAIADFSENRALLPEALFETREEKNCASL